LVGFTCCPQARKWFWIEMDVKVWAEISKFEIREEEKRFWSRVGHFSNAKFSVGRPVRIPSLSSKKLSGECLSAKLLSRS
jgi:hypothetical protein